MRAKKRSRASHLDSTNLDTKALPTATCEYTPLFPLVKGFTQNNVGAEHTAVIPSFSRHPVARHPRLLYFPSRFFPA